MLHAATATITTSPRATWRNCETLCAGEPGLDLCFPLFLICNLFEVLVCSELFIPLSLISFLLFFRLSYVWEHLEVGYVQGMCDLLAPLMVILDDGELIP